MHPASSSAFDASLGHALKSLLDAHGLPLLGDSGQLKSLLNAQFPQARREVSIVVQALDAGIPQALLRPEAGEASMASALRLATKLSDDTAMAPDAAQWAVHTWQQGIGMAASTVGATVLAMPAAARPLAAAQRQAVDVSSRPVAGAARRDPKLLAAGAAGAIALAGAGAWYAFMHSNLEVTGVRSAQAALVGDGKPQPVLLGFNARNTELKAVDVRYLRGDGTWRPATWTVNVNGNGHRTGELAAGSLAYRATAPMSTTFEYTLVSKDGKRSAPFEHTFNILPPVVITSAQVPTAPRLGQGYSVQLGYKKGAGDIVQITRRVVDSNVPWAEPEATLPVNLNQSSGTYDVRFDAPTQPMRSTLEFEMTDAMGVKSEPVRVAVNVAMQPITSGPATVTSVVLVSGGGDASGVGAVAGGLTGAALGNRIGKGSGRHAATVVGAVGGAFAGHAIEKNVRGPSVWDTTVRFDDGNTRRIRHSDAPGWSVGSRVTVANGAILR